MFQALRALPSNIQQYLVITGNYWAFTLTDGALRMLIVLHFHQIGFDALQMALLFVFYEIFGVITNLVGGWLGARIGLNKTMNIGLLLQVLALSMLLVPSEWLTVIWVMIAQALSGIAKDLNKMSAKSAIKLLVPKGQNSRLFYWVAILTGSKNALKGVGFFMGALLLSLFAFQGAIICMLVLLIAVLSLSLLLLKQDLGKSSFKAKFSQLFSNSAAINRLSLARLCLFAARDVWFVVALPVYLSQMFAWDHWQVGGFIAFWIIAYGLVQAITPKMSTTPSAKSALMWAALLAAWPALIALITWQTPLLWVQQLALIVGLLMNPLIIYSFTAFSVTSAFFAATY